MKKNLYKFATVVFCLFSSIQLSAQYQISGKIIQEDENEPLEFANVSLASADSTYHITGTTTDRKGKFQLKNIPSGDYLLTASYLGFTSKTVILNRLVKSIDLGNILLETAANELEGVTVTASNVTNTTDRLIVFVTDEQKAMSSNGINILTNLKLPRLIVNPLMNEVSLPGDESIQFCINGVKAQFADIRGLQPNDIIRVEYLDNPGLRYGNAGVVINYILKREVAGGSVSMDLGNAVTTSFGDDQVAAKFNYKKSEFGVIYAARYRNPDKVWTDKEQTFNFEDGSSMQRIDKGIPGKMSENSHHVTLNYNLLNKKSYFNATVRYSYREDEKKAHTQQYTSLKPGEITNVFQGSDTWQHLPSVDLYYLHSMKNKQTIMFNLVGTYIKSEIDQIYEQTEAEESITDIISNVNGKKYSIIGEGIYEKIFENNSRFSAGIKHTQAFANNDYAGDISSRTKMDQSDSYLYAEYAGKINKFSYMGGVGVSRSWAKQKGEEDYTYYTFRPKLTLQYNLTQNMFVRLQGEIYNVSPSLSNLSAIDQYIDTLQIRRGNPDLRPFLNYKTNFLFSWRKGGYGINFSTYYQYSPKPIMGDIFRENDMFVNTNDNQKNWQKLNSELMLNGDIIKNFLSVSVTGGVNRMISKGNMYKHTHTNFYYRMDLMARYKKLMAMFQSKSEYNNLWGESLNRGENTHLIMLTYHGGKFTIGGGIMFPFSSQYKREGEVMNRFSPTKLNSYANDFSRMVLLKFAWNFSYGRKAKGTQKRINNEDRDPGIMIAN